MGSEHKQTQDHQERKNGPLEVQIGFFCTTGGEKDEVLAYQMKMGNDRECRVCRILYVCR